MGAACPRSARSVREALCDTPPNSPSKLHTSARAVAASTSRARQESVSIKKATSAKKASTKKATLKPVDSTPAKKAAAAEPVAEEE